SKVYKRTLFREILSRAYSFLVKTCLSVSFSDPQCGFKAMKTGVARKLLPQVRNTNWFFDTELLALAQKQGFRIYEEPVTWEDDPSSSVEPFKTIIEDLLGLFRMSIKLRLHN
ncbi:MAG: glycosyltransferase family 2 protein, partial [Patescibacteria group bacterium]